MVYSNDDDARRHVALLCIIVFRVLVFSLILKRERCSELSLGSVMKGSSGTMMF